MQEDFPLLLEVTCFRALRGCSLRNPGHVARDQKTNQLPRFHATSYDEALEKCQRHEHCAHEVRRVS